MYFDISIIGDGDNEEEQRTLQRRMLQYSLAAMDLARQVDRIFVLHPSFLAGLKALDRAFQLSREFSVPAGVRLVGPIGSGKTSMLKYFLATLPSSTLFESGLGAIALRMPERPSAGRIVGMALAKLRYPFPKVSDTTIGTKRGILLEALERKGTRIVLIDEAGHMCAPGLRKAHTGDRGNEVTELIREWIDEAGIAVALLGDSLLNSLHEIDAALAARTPAVERLTDFSEDSPLWLGLLKAFVGQCKGFPLDEILAARTPKLIYAATKGNARRLKNLLIEAVLVATDQGKQKITQEVLAEAFRRVNGQASPESNPFLTGRSTEGQA